jgi:hypothetical protein
MSDEEKPRECRKCGRTTSLFNHDYNIWVCDEHSPTKAYDAVCADRDSMAVILGRSSKEREGLEKELAECKAERDTWKLNAETHASYINKLLDKILLLEKECGREPGDY